MNDTEIDEIKASPSETAPFVNGENQNDSESKKANERKLYRRKVIGLICLLGVILLWVGSSILMQFIFTDENFNKPFFLTYLDTSLFTIYLSGFIFRRKKWMELAKAKPQESSTASLLANEDSPSPPIIEKKRKLTLKEVVWLSFLFCPLWFIDNYTFNLSLTMTSVSSNTILSATSALFTLILSAIFKVEKFSFIKLAGVLVTLGGVIMVSLSDRTSDKESVWGDLLALLSALTYAIYVTWFKKKVEDEERVDNGMFLGFIGLFNILIFWPFLIILNYAKLEPFELPKGMVFLYLLLNSLFGTALSDYLWLQAVLMVSPVIATVGLSLTIPVAMISDMIIKRAHFPTVYIFGSIFVAIGFVTVNTDPEFVKKIFSKLKEKLRKR